MALRSEQVAKGARYQRERPAQRLVGAQPRSAAEASLCLKAHTFVLCPNVERKLCGSMASGMACDLQAAGSGGHAGAA